MKEGIKTGKLGIIWYVPTARIIENKYLCAEME